MSYTAYTAFIVTFHHLSALAAAILALIISAIIYSLFLRQRKNRWLIFVMVYVASFIVSSYVADEAFKRRPINLEIVRTN